MRNIHTALFALVATIGYTHVADAASDRDLLRNQAKEIVARERANGEPKDRCTLNANIYDGAIVARVHPGSSLLPGDRLLLLNGVKVQGLKAEDVVAVLRDLSPDATADITVDRNGEIVDVKARCTNARETSEVLLRALEFSAKGRFDDCVSVLSEIRLSDTRTETLKAKCAAVSKKSKRYNLPVLFAQAIEMAIEDAYYATTIRKDTVNLLRNLEGQIVQGMGQAKFDALVERTRSWPGGERMYDESEPDWALFRRAAEQELRSRLIDPDSARIQWTHGFIWGTWKPFLSTPVEGYWTCGLINARNRMGGYVGNTAFVVVVDVTGIVRYSEIGEADELDLLAASCNRSAKLLPQPPVELTASVSDQPNVGSVSIAEEIRKLAELRDSGLITEEEFEKAKKNLLDR